MTVARQTIDKPAAVRLTFRGGGWALAVAGLISLAVIIWAFSPIVLRAGDVRPPGNGSDPATYGFDLSTCLVPREQLVAAMQHRDMLLPLTDPTILAGDALAAANAPGGNQYLVSGDLVVGVQIDGESRAYPVSLLLVHEIVNDTLAERPIAVTYNPLSGSAVVLDRRVNGQTLEFGISGLLYNCNLLMYDRRGPIGPGESRITPAESLWSQLQARAITGPAASTGQRLTVLPSALVSWAAWSGAHPGTSVVDRDPALMDRYKNSNPGGAFDRPGLPFPVEPSPPPDGPPAKSRVVAVTVGTQRRVYPLSLIAARADSAGHWTDSLGPATLHFQFEKQPQSVMVSADPPDAITEMVNAYWFAWHAMHPEDAPAGAN